jgi:hypothetical protein
MAGSLSVLVVPVKQGEWPSTATLWREGGRPIMEPLPGNTPDASTSERVSTQWQRIASTATAGIDCGGRLN